MKSDSAVISFEFSFESRPRERVRESVRECERAFQVGAITKSTCFCYEIQIKRQDIIIIIMFVSMPSYYLIWNMIFIFLALWNMTKTIKFKNTHKHKH